jgi:photosystem II stability/assembly factor-like uncharacterized protein
VDGGSSWQKSDEGLDGARYNTLDLAVHPNDENIAYLGSLSGGVYKTMDGGLTWIPANGGLLAGVVRSIAIDPHQPETVIAGTGGAGIWISQDEGTTWTQASVGLPPEANIFGLVFDPAQPGVIYAADRFSGVYASQDAGKTWMRMNIGLFMRAVNELAISKDGQHLYAATEGNGVYRLDLNNKEPLSAEAPVSSALGQPTSLGRTATVSEATAITQTPPTVPSKPGISGPVWPVISGAFAVLIAAALFLIKRKKS